MATITKDQRQSLEAEHGELLVLETDLGDMAFKAASEAVFMRFQQEVTEASTRWTTTKALMKSCLVWPEWDVLDAEIIKKRPGLVIKIGDKLVEFVGMVEGSVRKK